LAFLSCQNPEIPFDPKRHSPQKKTIWKKPRRIPRPGFLLYAFAASHSTS